MNNSTKNRLNNQNLNYSTVNSSDNANIKKLNNSSNKVQAKLNNYTLANNDVDLIRNPTERLNKLNKNGEFSNKENDNNSKNLNGINQKINRNIKKIANTSVVKGNNENNSSIQLKKLQKVLNEHEQETDDLETETIDCENEGEVEYQHFKSNGKALNNNNQAKNRKKQSEFKENIEEDEPDQDEIANENDLVGEDNEDTEDYYQNNVEVDEDDDENNNDYEGEENEGMCLINKFLIEIYKIVNILKTFPVRKPNIEIKYSGSFIFETFPSDCP